MSPWDRYSVFIDRIFHHRHENWLHSLDARILLYQLPVPNVLDKPEAFFVKYQQKKIMKSNRNLQKTVLNTHRIVWLGYFLHRWVYIRDTTHFEEVFLKNGTTDIEEFDQKWYCYFGYFWILISIWNSEQKRVRPDIFGICPWTLEVWLNVSLNWKQFRHTLRLQSGCIFIRECIDNQTPCQNILTLDWRKQPLFILDKDGTFGILP